MKTLIALLATLPFAPLTALDAADAPPPTVKPNIVFIYADDWGWGDLSCHGHPWLQTPNIDRLAQEGTDFQQFNVLNPVCSPSRTAMMTGNFPARFSVHQHFATPAKNHARNMPDWLDPKAPTLPRFLKQAGYRTAHFGKWHLTNAQTKGAPKPEAYGYDESAVFNGGAGWGKPAGLHDTAKDTVAFIVRWPGHTPAGVKNTSTVLTAVDLLPTLCAAAGVKLPADYHGDGENLLAALQGDAKFGMFVHWGIYSVDGGEYNGKKLPNSAEWMMNRGKIPIAEYRKYADRFNPTKFDAQAFVKMAKDAGMRYLVITAKHHDGFSMFNSHCSDYNVSSPTIVWVRTTRATTRPSNGKFRPKAPLTRTGRSACRSAAVGATSSATTISNPQRS